MFVYKTKLRVRYADTDQMGYAYYGNYATYYEVARVEAFRYLGVTYKSLEESGVIMPVIELKCQFKTPAKYDDLLTIKVMIPHMPKSTILYQYDVFNSENHLINQGKTLLAFVNKITHKPIRTPKIIKDKLQSFFD